MGDRIGVVNKGELVQVGTPHEIYNSPTNTFVASFVGTPAINLLDVQVDLAQGRGAQRRAGLRASTRPRASGWRRCCRPTAKVRLGIRPEDVALVADGGIPGSIYGAENHGAEIIAVIEAGGHGCAPPCRRRRRPR